MRKRSLKNYIQRVTRMVLMTLVVIFSLQACFWEDDSNSSGICEGRPANEVISETTQFQCEDANGEWLGEGQCYCGES